MCRACCRSAALSLALLAVPMPTCSSLAQATGEDIEAAARKGGVVVCHDARPLNAERIVAATSAVEAAKREAGKSCR
jgi:hypothetical protein